MTNDKPQGNDDFRQAAMDALKDFGKAEAERREEIEARKTEEAKKGNFWVVSRWIILIVCIGITIFQMPKLIAALSEEEKPLRHGTFDTDEQTDQCIRNLWQISKILQEGNMPGDDIICPASQKPFVVVKTKEDVIVRSPNPELYGFKDIRVSKKSPVPEIVK
jgi:hypothetical protein